MYKRKILEIPLYNFCLLEIIQTDDTEKLSKIFGEPCEAYDDYCAFVQKTSRDYRGRKQRKCISVVFGTEYKGCIYALIAHEVIHIKNIIGKTMLEHWNPESDEPEAYLVEWLTETIVKFLDK